MRTKPKSTLEIASLARTHTSMAIRTLAHIAKNPKSSESARVKAAEVLLDRGWGKAKQTTEHTGQIEHNYVAVMPEKAETTEEWTRRFAPTTLQ